MNELKDLFDTVLTAPGRDRLDVDAAVRRGRRRRWAKTGAVVASTTLAVGIAAALVVTALPRHSDGATVATPSRSTALSLPSAQALRPPVEGAIAVHSGEQLEGTWRPVVLAGHDMRVAVDVAMRHFTLVITPATADMQTPAGSVVWSVGTGCATSTGYWQIVDGEVTSVVLDNPVLPCPMNTSAPHSADDGSHNLQAVLPRPGLRAYLLPADPAHPERLLLAIDEQAVASYERVPTSTQEYLAGAPKLVEDAQHHSEPVNDPAELVGRWLAVEVGGHDVSGRPARLRRIAFEEGAQWVGTDGCNTWSGTYEVRGGRLHAPDTFMTAVACGRVDVPAAATMLALTTADQVRFTHDLTAGQAPDTPSFALLEGDRVLARFVLAP